MSHRCYEPARPVVITGWATRTDVAGSTEELWQRVLHDVPRVGFQHTPNTELAKEAHLEPGDAVILGRHQLLALSVLEAAWDKAGLPEERNRLRGRARRVRCPRFGCVTGSSLSGMSTMLEETTASPKPSAYSLSRWRGNAIAAAVAMRFGLGGADFSLNAASATGSQSFFLAGSLVAGGLLDAVAVVAAEAALPPLLMSAASRNGSVSHDPASRPLAAGRSGMQPSEGAAAVILESAAHAASRGGVPRAQWLGGDCENEVAHLVAAEADGAVLRRQLEEVRAMLCLSGRSLDWICLHATGTRQFDAIEIATVRSVFGRELPWLSAMKRVFGHALGASGLIEAALVLEGFSRGTLPVWPGDTDPAFGLSAPSDNCASRKPDTALLIGQGMGGTVVTNVLGAERI